MKRNATLFALLAALCVCAAPAQTKPTARSRTTLSVKPRAAASGAVFNAIDFTWTWVANVPACPTNGSPADCAFGFTLTDTTTGAVIASAGTASGQISIAATTFTWAPAGGLYYGTQCFSLVTVGYGDEPTGGGSAPLLESTPATVCLTNSLTSLDPPTAFTATPVAQ